MKKSYLYNGSWLLCLFLSLFLFNSIETKANEFGNPKLIENQIEGYYKLSYDIYLNMEMLPMDKYLDSDSIQSKNKITALQRTIDTWKYTIDKGYIKDVRERHPIYFNYKSINIDLSKLEATVVVDITGQHTEKQEAYPMFVSFGENKFKFRILNDNWVIVEHDYIDPLFELSKTKLIEYSREDNFKRIDKAYDKTISMDIEPISNIILAEIHIPI